MKDTASVIGNYAALLADEKIDKAVSALVHAINHREKVVSGLVEAVTGNEHAPELLTEAKHVGVFLRSALTFKGVDQSTLDPSSRNRYQYLVRTSVDAICEAMGLSEPKASPDWVLIAKLEALRAQAEKHEVSQGELAALDAAIASIKG